MTPLVKIACATGIVTGASGIGLIGSNYAFPKSKIVNIEQNSTKDWEDKLPELANKLKADTQLAAKIDSTSGQTKLAFQTSPENSKEFKNKQQAVETLKAWCIKEGAEKAKLKDVLCKKTIREGWLFGNRV